MPISYSIDQQHGVIREEWSGDVDAAQLAAYWQRYLADPSVLAIRKTVVDLRQCRIQFTGAQLSELVQRIVIPALEGRDWKSALVVEQSVQFGVSRQYQVFANHYSSDSIFTDHDAAIAWLIA